MIDEHLYNKFKKCYKFDINFFNALDDKPKLKYLYNYFQWKCMEAEYLRNENALHNFFNLKNLITQTLDENTVMFKYGKTTFDEKLYNKELEYILKKITMEIDFI